MNKIAIALGVVALLMGALAYNVWRASVEPVTATPTLLEQGQIKLRGQLEDAKRSEAEVERQNWNSTDRLTALIKAHQHRIEELNGNSQSGEIVAYDKESIARLENRIAAIEEQQRAAREAALQAENAEQTAGTTSAQGESKAFPGDAKKSSATGVKKQTPDSKSQAPRPDAVPRKGSADSKKPASPAPL